MVEHHTPIRIFVGLPLEEFDYEIIAKWRVVHPALNALRWIKPHNVHLTLIAPWYVPSLEPQQTALADLPLPQDPIKLRFHTIEYGPSLHKPSLVWMIGNPTQPVLDLISAAQTTFKRPAEQRSFLPHLTVARFNPHQWATLPSKQFSEPVEQEITFKRVALYTSKLTPVGAEYTIAAERKV